MSSNILEPLLSLEEQYYQEGYNEGLADGERAGRIEGRIFGLEKGFYKFLELGQIQGRCSVWKEATRHEDSASVSVSVSASVLLKKARLEKHVRALGEIVESPPTKNDEDAVEEFEDVLRRAMGKVKIISSVLGEKSRDEDGCASPASSGVRVGEEGSIEEGSFGPNVRR